MKNLRARLKSACSEKCPSRWCCSVQNFVPPPLSCKEINIIQKATGLTDFYKKKNGNCVLKVKKNGYCTFFDQDKKLCSIYELRPFDCQMYPFDFIFNVAQKKWLWLIWDCPYSQMMNNAEIEHILTKLERNCQQELSLICDYENSSLDTEKPDGFRVLRQMNIIPSK